MAVAVAVADNLKVWQQSPMTRLLAAAVVAVVAALSADNLKVGQQQFGGPMTRLLAAAVVAVVADNLKWRGQMARLLAVVVAAAAQMANDTTDSGREGERGAGGAEPEPAADVEL